MQDCCLDLWVGLFVMDLFVYINDLLQVGWNPQSGSAAKAQLPRRKRTQNHKRCVWGMSWHQHIRFYQPIDIYFYCMQLVHCTCTLVTLSMSLSKVICLYLSLYVCIYNYIYTCLIIYIYRVHIRITYGTCTHVFSNDCQLFDGLPIFARASGWAGEVS